MLTTPCFSPCLTRTNNFPLLNTSPTKIGFEFSVGSDNGLLPKHAPLTQLPQAFADVEDLLQHMPIVRTNGQPGLLANGSFGETLKKACFAPK